ncbi:MAG: MFS transporter [Verrucomicrobia bacterium]|nr:MFS transporter [Verrucomicrobiota bacterium]
MSSTSEATGFRTLTSQQKKSGLAAWLGWMFDGLDMHIYTLVATPFVAQLLVLPRTDKQVGEKGALINAAFLIGWALGGAFFGRIGDLMGRSRALCLTILCYAAFTGLSAISTEWWHLMVFRFLSALGIGGEWAVGASLLSETWPKRWRPWIAATLQTAVNIGVLLACFFGYLFENAEPRYIFLVGVFPALIVLWIRRAVPETDEWHAARAGSEKPPGLTDLFRGTAAKTTWIVLAICGVSLTAHWTFMFWQQKYIRDLPEVRDLSSAGQNRAAVIALMVLMAGSILGNYAAAAVARAVGYRKAVVSFCLIYGVVMGVTFLEARAHFAILIGFFFIGLCQGVFGLFTMCLPPLFPTLLRTTGAGFCYNIGRLIAAGGTVFFGLFTKVGDVRQALLYAAILFIPAAGLACWLPEPKD